MRNRSKIKFNVTITNIPEEAKDEIASDLKGMSNVVQVLYGHDHSVLFFFETDDYYDLIDFISIMEIYINNWNVKVRFVSDSFTVFSFER